MEMVDEIELKFVELRLAGQLLFDVHGNVAFLELNISSSSFILEEKIVFFFLNYLKKKNNNSYLTLKCDL